MLLSHLLCIFSLLPSHFSSSIFYNEEELRRSKGFYFPVAKEGHFLLLTSKEYQFALFSFPGFISTRSKDNAFICRYGETSILAFGCECTLFGYLASKILLFFPCREDSMLCTVNVWARSPSRKDEKFAS